MYMTIVKIYVPIPHVYQTLHIYKWEILTHIDIVFLCYT
jgi:hypothetical protein